VVLYPGDLWDVGAPHNSAEAIRRYNDDFDRALKAEPTKAATVSIEDLEKASKAFCVRCSEKNNQLILNTLPSAVAYLSDLDIHLELSFRTGLKRIEERQPDIILSSDSLLNCLTTEWGGETLVINGRFQVPPGGRPRRFFWIFRVARHNSIGTALDLKFLGRQVVSKARAAASGQ
jgi:hypothetical protein